MLATFGVKTFYFQRGRGDGARLWVRANITLKVDAQSVLPFISTEANTSSKQSNNKVTKNYNKSLKKVCAFVSGTFGDTQIAELNCRQ